MKNLSDIQRDFQNSILQNNNTVEKNIESTKKLTATERLQIYQNSYFERLLAALTQDFPVLKAVLGERAFSSLIRDYGYHHPSQDYNLRYIGKNLSDFILSRDPQFKSYSDLAKWEYLICEAQLDYQKREFESEFNVIEVWEHYLETGEVLFLTCCSPQ